MKESSKSSPLRLDCSHLRTLSGIFWTPSFLLIAWWSSMGESWKRNGEVSVRGSLTTSINWWTLSRRSLWRVKCWSFSSNWLKIKRYDYCYFDCLSSFYKCWYFIIKWEEAFQKKEPTLEIYKRLSRNMSENDTSIKPKAHACVKVPESYKDTAAQDLLDSNLI